MFRKKQKKISDLLIHFDGHGEIFTNLFKIVNNTIDEKKLLDIYTAFITTIDEVKSSSQDQKLKAMLTLKEHIISIKEKEKEEQQKEDIESILDQI